MSEKGKVLGKKLMEKDKAEKLFPSFFSNFNYELPEGAKEEEINVYRICINGYINREAFISSYESVVIKQISENKDIYEGSTDVSHYSTSCFEKARDAKRIFKCLSRHYPQPIIAKGVTSKDCGPCQRTKEREGGKTSHVDWWIYKDSHPEKYFEEVDINEKK